MNSKLFSLVVGILFLSLAGCAVNQAQPGGEELNTRGKTIILDMPGTPWNEIAKKLQAYGFTVLSKNSAYSDLALERARYIVFVHKQAPYEFNTDPRDLTRKDPSLTRPCMESTFEVDIMDSRTGKVARTFQSESVKRCGTTSETVSLDLINKIASTLIHLPD